MPKITEALLRKGYSEGDVKKILGENTLRLMADVERVGKELNSRQIRSNCCMKSACTIRDVEMIEMNERNTTRQIARTVRLAGWLLGLTAAILLQGPAQARPQAQPAAKSSTAQGTTAKKSTGTSTARPAYDRALLRPALLKEKAPDEYKVQFSTTRGDFVVTVTRSWAPLGADRFYNLVKHHFYDNASFFRVLPNFMAQFGISAYPAVNAVWTNANIKDDPVTQSNTRGYVTFATAGANTRTTQVFINFGDNARLDHDGLRTIRLGYRRDECRRHVL